MLRAKSKHVLLLFLSLLLFGAENSGAQNNAVLSDIADADLEKNGWALKKNSLSKPAVSDNIVSDDEPDSLQGVADLKPQVNQAKLLEDNKIAKDSAAKVVPDKSNRVIDISGLANVRDDDLSGLDRYYITVGAEPIDVPTINTRPTAILSPELRDSLERQFQEIQTLKETEDAFSAQLGESFLSYGRSLMRSGRIDEARKMLIQALHITKINNGVNSIEQRPVLRELFEMNFALGNVDEADEQLRKIIELEKKKPKSDDTYSFDMIVRLGNKYLDLYQSTPIISELSLLYLNRSIMHFSYAANRYGNRPLGELPLPYGELALAYHLKSRIENGTDRSLRLNSNDRFFGEGRLSSRTSARGDFSRPSRLGARQGSALNSFYRSERFLYEYLRKAKGEQDLINTIQALLGLGDLNLLSGRVGKAGEFYDLAWSGAQNLPETHSIVKSFNVPVKLPSFTSSIVRDSNVSTRQVELIPLSISIDNDGRVLKVARDALNETTTALTNRARRLVKRVKFRPIIENGKLIPISDYRYEVEVPVRKSKAAVAAKESAE